MAPEYVEKLRELLESIKPILSREISEIQNSIEVKLFFGGAAAYVDGLIFMSLSRVGMALKLPEAERDRLFCSKLVKSLRYFPNAPIKKQYALFQDEILANDKLLKSLIETSIIFTLSNDDKL